MPTTPAPPPRGNHDPAHPALAVETDDDTRDIPALDGSVADEQATHTDVDALPKLAAQLATLGFHAALKTPGDGIPCLIVRNPRASALAETVYTCDGSFWWSWKEPITGTDQPQAAAAVVARVLRAVGE
jgi:hypothetical protein